MAQNETWLSHDLMNPVKVQYLDGNLFSMDNAGNLIGVKLTRDGVDYDGGGSVSANVIRADGGTVAVTGALSGNVATVVLPQAAYAVPGVVSIIVKLTVDGAVITIAAVVANVYESSTSTTIDPGTIIPSIESLIAQINAAIASIPGDYSNVWEVLGNSAIAATDTGKYIDLSGSTANINNPGTSSSYNYYVVQCSAGDEFTINAVGGNAPRAWGILDGSGNILRRAAVNATIENLAVKMPTGTAYLVINDKGGKTSYYGKTAKCVRTEVGRSFETDEVYEKALTDSVDNGYLFLNYGSVITGETLRAADGLGEVGTSGASNWVFSDYVKIPRGNIYLVANSDYQCRVVFYDAFYNYVESMFSGDFGYLTGVVYNNTQATYMRVAGYKSGGATGTDFCYAYAYNNLTDKGNDRIIYPLWTNNITDGTASATNVSTDYIKSEYPVMVRSLNLENYVFGVRLYDDNYTQIVHYSPDDSISYVSIPAGVYFKVYARAANNTQISAKEAIQNISIERRFNNLGVHTFYSSQTYLRSAKNRVGNINISYTEKALRLVCDDPGSYAYNLTLYASANNPAPQYLQYDTNVDMIIPPRSYYRYVVGGSAEISFDEIETVASHIHFVPIELNTPEMVSMVTADGLTRQQFDNDTMPDYYVDHMASKVTTINTLKTSCAVQFGFVTDYHFGTYNNTHTARPLLTELAKHTNMEMLFNGGDIWTAGARDGRTFGFAKQRLVSGIQETRPNAPCECYYIFGNHDTGLDYTSVEGQTVRYGPWMTIPEVKSLMGNESGQDIVYDPAGKGFSYYFDKGDFRYIVLDRYMAYVNLGNEDADDSYTFLIESLLSAGNKTIVFFTHLYFRDSAQTVTNNISSIIVTYNARQTLARQSPDEYVVADFTNCTGHVCCWITGHTHQDQSTTLSDGTPVIVTTTCNAGAELGGLDRTVGTVNENAFDVISIDTTNKIIYATRIGAGSDRQFSYADI